MIFRESAKAALLVPELWVLCLARRAPHAERHRVGHQEDALGRERHSEGTRASLDVVNPAAVLVPLGVHVALCRMLCTAIDRWDGVPGKRNSGRERVPAWAIRSRPTVTFALSEAGARRGRLRRAKRLALLHDIHEISDNVGRTLASRIVDSTQTLVVQPVTKRCVMPRSRSTESNSVP